MGVYLCVGQSIHQVERANAVDFSHFGSFEKVHEMLAINPVFIFLGKATHKIKKKAEQLACENVLSILP